MNRSEPEHWKAEDRAAAKPVALDPSISTPPADWKAVSSFRGLDWVLPARHQGQSSLVARDGVEPSRETT
jgi:hypothetical protein